MLVDRDTYTTGNAKHAYEVECYKGNYSKATSVIFEVYATNRDHAARIVGRDGWSVASVNMIG